jgi:hypothetical protein
MHINDLILRNIKDVLNNKYSIYIQDGEWELFKQPLQFDETGTINLQNFQARQNKAIEIIKNILDTHGKAEIVDFLGQLATIEPGIQDLQPWVRDHVVHALNTFLVGIFVLENITFPEDKINRFPFAFMWKICGPTHDLGYPIEIAHNIRALFYIQVNDILDRLNSPSSRIRNISCINDLNSLCRKPDALDIIQKRLTSWKLGIEVKHYIRWLNERNLTDHGVISSLAQLKIIDAMYFSYNPDRKKQHIYHAGLSYNQIYFDQDIVSAASALFIHNISLDYGEFSSKIRFDIAPLAFLLFLCDTFQEWDRYSEQRPVYSGNDFNIECNLNTISLFVPNNLEQKVSSTLSKRLQGLNIKVNGHTVVS